MIRRLEKIISLAPPPGFGDDALVDHLFLMANTRRHAYVGFLALVLSYDVGVLIVYWYGTVQEIVPMAISIAVASVAGGYRWWIMPRYCVPMVNADDIDAAMAWCCVNISKDLWSVETWDGERALFTFARKSDAAIFKMGWG